MSNHDRPPSPSFLRYMFFVYLFFCFYVGLCLIMVPWVPWIWESNYFLSTFPSLRPLLLSPYLRGAISGLGLLNIVIGISEIVEQRRRKRGKSDN